MRARYYDPLNGRFNRTDPFAGNNLDPQSLHKYLYVHANPVNATDPSGESLMLGVGAISIKLLIHVAIWTVALSVLVVRFGPKGRKPTPAEQSAIEAARNVIKNHLVGKTFVLHSGEKIKIREDWYKFSKYYVSDTLKATAEHRYWPFARIILSHRPNTPGKVYDIMSNWFALTPEEGACTLVHELYHYHHWGFGWWEEDEAHELEAVWCKNI